MEVLPPASASAVPAPAPPIGILEFDELSRQIQHVFRANRRESQACWRAAYAGRAPDAGVVAKLVVSFHVSGGSVHDITSTGDPRGFSGLAACITANVKRWRFPSALNAPLNVPFVFAGAPRSDAELENESQPMTTPL
jgi:hypothetical protein